MRSLARLTAAAEVIGRGDFTPWLPPPGGDEVGKLSFAIGSMVERIGEMLRQVEQSRQMAALGEFSAYLAHEIRNPLSSLKLNLQGVARDVRAGRVTEQLSEVIESCVQEINRLDRVVHTILRLGRPEPGAHTPCAVHAVVDDAVHLLAMQLQRRNIQVEVRRQAFADQVLASGEQLKGVLLNLFLNAADAMPAGGRLRVWTHNAPGRDGRPSIRVHVADDGAGVPPSLRERIFDPFFTTKGTTRKGEPKGTGLGLAICKEIVEHHKGRIEVQSEIGKGSTFSIYLPTDAASSAPTPAPAAA
jgi:two-component system NtrC family sensor kinase